MLKITSVQDEQMQPVFYGFIIFPWGVSKALSLVACPLKGFDCIIGRDVMMDWNFIYNGKDGFITICD
jgi:hypothetical protein